MGHLGACLLVTGHRSLDKADLWPGVGACCGAALCLEAVPAGARPSGAACAHAWCVCIELCCVLGKATKIFPVN